MARPVINLHPLLQAFKPSDSDAFDYVKAAHLWNRAAFGGTPDDIAASIDAGPEAAVGRLMDFPDAPVEELGKETGPDLSSLDGYPSSFAEVRRMFAGKSEEERKELRKKLLQANREAQLQTMGWWLRRMATGPYPMHEKLVLFWHGHFTTGAKEERQAILMWNQNELHRRMAAGNFRSYVKAISRDPAMLDYLNNTQNKKAHPNENYARELMELFTLGRDQYTEQDIKESARAFTGWSHEGEEFVFKKNDHDTGMKTFMGRTGNFDGDDVIDIILQHKSCAPYIASRLWNYFAYEPDMTPGTVDRAMMESLGDVLRANDWELRPVLQTIFTSRAFYSDRALGTQIKSPIQLVVGTVRALGVEMPNIRVLLGQLSQMGQVPLSPPNVKGWPGGRAWINTSTLFVRYNTGVFLTGGEIPDIGRMKLAPKLVLGGRSARGGSAVAFSPALPNTAEPGLRSAEDVAGYWVQRLVQRPVSDDKLQTLVETLGDKPHDERNIRKMIQLIVSMPDYQLC